ncbi:hypothetical protein Klosneuvirus_3_71 [Klosneuvirus KNV1]|uniref:Uncharacterized protein n=1 Tax=Klosneuvirus KNV1 TaxID=1977640 RepID=A0A1V0SJN3_9VIRU|nr:hypothetical protein Klosneuvirus_3_71 [Klosneuvirus KNV1]
MARLLIMRCVITSPRPYVRFYQGSDPADLVEPCAKSMPLAKNLWLDLIQLEQKHRANILKCTQLRKQLELLMSEEDIKNIRDEEVNRDLTIAAIRHTYYDPTGEFTEVNFFQKKSQAPKNHQSLKKSSASKKDFEETEEDRWLTERSHEFAKNA